MVEKLLTVFLLFESSTMNVQVLGSGCPTCKKLYEVVSQVVTELGDDSIELDYITGAEGMQQMIKLGALSSPVLTVNGKIAMTGFTSDTQKIKDLILEKDQKT